MVKKMHRLLVDKALVKPLVVAELTIDDQPLALI
jgi:hypothetical protein